ncbi:MAG: hypothetical protein ACHQ49_08675 [Elusimicrobiota bacterium]
MTAEDAIRLTREHVERQFPKRCQACGAEFASLVDYLRRTKHVGDPASYDDESEPRPRDPMGIFAFANCRCGSTLTITSEGMSLLTLWRLMGWARAESRRRGVGFGQVVAWVRDEIDRRVLAENTPGPRQ